MPSCTSDESRAAAMPCGGRRRPLTAMLAAAAVAISLLATTMVAQETSTQKPPPSSKTAGGGTGKGTGASAAARAAAATPYFPPAHEWKQEAPAAVGMDAARLEQAIAFAVANENPGPKDLAQAHQLDWGREPYDALVGPTRPRAALNGIIIRRGAVVAEWGDTRRVDMTYSVTKTFLSTVVGLAWDRGLIRDLQDKVMEYVPEPDLFDTPHNAAITWDHLLRQTSDWRGTLWGKPDWADRPVGKTPADYPNVPLTEPGTVYEYNDVRVNLLALAALHVWRRPLPQVLREQIMEPIGASNTWRWHGYESSWIELDGQRIQSVSGGGHWGGGMFISARDMARFGYLFLRNGKWRDRQLVSERFITAARTPGPAKADYGFMNWFLNTKAELKSAPATSVTFRGNGQNIIYIDWEHDLVVVVRWIRSTNALDTFLGHVIGALAPTSTQPQPEGGRPAE